MFEMFNVPFVDVAIQAESTLGSPRRSVLRVRREHCISGSCPLRSVAPLSNRAQGSCVASQQGPRSIAPVADAGVPWRAPQCVDEVGLCGVLVAREVLGTQG